MATQTWTITLYVQAPVTDSAGDYPHDETHEWVREMAEEATRSIKQTWLRCRADGLSVDYEFGPYRD